MMNQYFRILFWMIFPIGVFAQTVPLTFEVSVSMGSSQWVLKSAQATEVSLGTMKVNKAATVFSPELQKIFTIKNNSAAAKLFSVTVPGGFVVTRALNPTTIPAGGTATFGISLIPSKVGLRTGQVTVASGTDRFTFSIGAMVWPLIGLPVNFAKYSGAPAISPSPAPSGTVSRNAGADFSVALKLGLAKTVVAYRALRPSLVLENYESALLRANARIGELVITANRSGFSAGAKLALRDDLAAATQVPVRDLMNQLNKIILELKNDSAARARLAVLTIFSQIVDQMPTLRPTFRLYIQAYLSPRAIWLVPEVNAAGKMYLLQGFVKAYLQTDPPVNEAAQVIEALLRSLTDNVIRTPIVKMVIAKYPSKFTRTSNIARTVSFNPATPSALGLGSVCRVGGQTRACRSGLVCAVHDLCSPPGNRLSPSGEVCRTNADCVTGTTCTTTSPKVCR